MKALFWNLIGTAITRVPALYVTSAQTEVSCGHDATGSDGDRHTTHVSHHLEMLRQIESDARPRPTIYQPNAQSSDNTTDLGTTIPPIAQFFKCSTILKAVFSQAGHAAPTMPQLTPDCPPGRLQEELVDLIVEGVPVEFLDQADMSSISADAERRVNMDEAFVLKILRYYGDGQSLGTDGDGDTLRDISAMLMDRLSLVDVTLARLQNMKDRTKNAIALLSKHSAELGSSSTATPTSRPAFQWAQATDAVFLNVKFSHRMTSPGVIVEDLNVTIEEGQVTVEAIHPKNRKKYLLTLPLMYEVEPDDSSYSMSSVGRIQVTLKKKVMQVWPTLVHPDRWDGGKVMYWFDMAERYNYGHKSYFTEDFVDHSYDDDDEL